MRNVYLDYSATTPVKEEVLKEMIPYFTEKFGNPSSLYDKGLEAKAAVDHAREQLAALINADPKEIYFTAGGTEADNWSLMGVADKLKDKGNHIITTKIEHHAILHSCEFLEKHGYEVTYLGIDKNGRISLEELENAITDKTILISVMMVNNEIGTVQPIKEIGKIAKAHKIIFHTDAVQALGNVPIDVKDMGIDLMSMSSHKIYGPKGEGALFMRKGLRISNYIHGGAQENSMRAGTENVAGIVGMAAALQEHFEAMETEAFHLYSLTDALIQGIQDIPHVLHGENQERLPGLLSLAFPGYEGEALLHRLDLMGIAVSTGSACDSKRTVISHVLKSMSVPEEIAQSTIRISLGVENTIVDVEAIVNALHRILKKD